MKRTGALLVLLLMPFLSYGTDHAPTLPKEEQNWLDHKTISWEQLRGKVVLLNVWTFG